MHPYLHFYFFPVLSFQRLVGSKCSTGKWELIWRHEVESLFLSYASRPCCYSRFSLVNSSFLSSHFFLSQLSPQAPSHSHCLFHVIFVNIVLLCSLSLWPLVYFVFPPPTFFLSSASFSLSNWSKKQASERLFIFSVGTIPVACCWTDLFWDLQNVL